MLNIGYVGVFYDIAHCSLVAETTTMDFPTSVYEPNFFVKTIHTIITFYIPDFKKEKGKDLTIQPKEYIWIKSQT